MEEYWSKPSLRGENILSNILTAVRLRFFRMLFRRREVEGCGLLVACTAAFHLLCLKGTTRAAELRVTSYPCTKVRVPGLQ